MTNCPNCGAPIEPYQMKCSYCGSYYFDFAAFDCTKKCFVKFKVPFYGHDLIITTLAIPSLESIETNTEYNDISDSYGTTLIRMPTNKACELKATFRCIQNYKDNTLFTIEKQTPEPDHCPICGNKTSEGKKGGKVCFDCVNKKRGI